MTAERPGTHRSWMSLRSSRWPFVDVFFVGRNATHVWNTCRWWAEVWPARVVFPLRRRPFGHLLLPGPCDAAAALRATFPDFERRCRGREYDHLRDSPVFLWLRRPAEVDCSELETMWPYMRRRRWTDAAGTRRVTETLWSPGGQRAIRQVTLVDQC